MMKPEHCKELIARWDGYAEKYAEADPAKAERFARLASQMRIIDPQCVTAAIRAVPLSTYCEDPRSTFGRRKRRIL